MSLPKVSLQPLNTGVLEKWCNYETIISEKMYDFFITVFIQHLFVLVISYWSKVVNTCQEGHPCILTLQSLTNNRTWKTPCYNHTYTINLLTVIPLEVRNESNNQKFQTNSLKLKRFLLLLEQNIFSGNDILRAPYTFHIFHENKWWQCLLPIRLTICSM